MPLRAVVSAANPLPAEELDRLRLIVHADVRVAHRHLDVGVPGEFLGFGQRRTVADKSGDVGVPAGGVEVGDALRRLVGDADPLQVFFHHQPGAALSQLGKQELIRFHSGQPLPQHGDELGVERQDVHLAMLRTSGLHAEDCRLAVEAETAGHETRDFLPPEPGHVGQDVDACPLLAVETLDFDVAGAGGFHQLRHFLG